MIIFLFFVLKSVLRQCFCFVLRLLFTNFIRFFFVYKITTFKNNKVDYYYYKRIKRTKQTKIVRLCYMYANVSVAAHFLCKNSNFIHCEHLAIYVDAKHTRQTGLNCTSILTSVTVNIKHIT